MKSIFILTIVLCCLITIVHSQQEEEGRKTNLLLRRPGSRNIFAKTISTTTTLAPDAGANEEDYGDNENGDEYADEDPDGQQVDKGQSAQIVTEATTEAAKKFGPIIRPFRSNDDLLNALKKRQQDVKAGKKVLPKSTAISESEHSEHESHITSPPVQLAAVNSQSKLNDKNGRKRFGNARSIPVPKDEEAKNEEETSAPTPRPGRSRFSFNKSIRN